jgi:uncharacterized protein YndB with AHSA1/START domain
MNALLEMSRVVEAPCDKVFDRWLCPEQLARWWDTGGETRPVQVEVQPDGAYRVRGARGAGRWTHVAIHDAARPGRIVFTWGGDQAGTETMITVTFTDQGPRTQLTLQQRVR